MPVRPNNAFTNRQTQRSECERSGIAVRTLTIECVTIIRTKKCTSRKALTKNLIRVGKYCDKRNAKLESNQIFGFICWHQYCNCTNVSNASHRIQLNGPHIRNIVCVECENYCSLFVTNIFDLAAATAAVAAAASTYQGLAVVFALPQPISLSQRVFRVEKPLSIYLSKIRCHREKH